MFNESSENIELQKINKSLLKILNEVLFHMTFKCR